MNEQTQQELIDSLVEPSREAWDGPNRESDRVKYIDDTHSFCEGILRELNLSANSCIERYKELNKSHKWWRLRVIVAGGIVAVILNNVILRSGGLRSFQPYAHTAAAICALVTIISILCLSGVLLPKYFRPYFFEPAAVRNKTLRRLNNQLEEIGNSLKEQNELGQEIKKTSAEIKKTLSSVKLPGRSPGLARPKARPIGGRYHNERTIEEF